MPASIAARPLIDDGAGSGMAIRAWLLPSGRRSGGPFWKSRLKYSH